MCSTRESKLYPYWIPFRATKARTRSLLMFFFPIHSFHYDRRRIKDVNTFLDFRRHSNWINDTFHSWRNKDAERCVLNGDPECQVRARELALVRAKRCTTCLHRCKTLALPTTALLLRSIRAVPRSLLAVGPLQGQVQRGAILPPGRSPGRHGGDAGGGGGEGAHLLQGGDATIQGGRERSVERDVKVHL